MRAGLNDLTDVVLKKMMAVFTAGLATCLLVFCSSELVAQSAQKIYHNGKIITVNDTAPTAEAVAVRDGEILAVGSKTDVLRTSDEKTELVDLRGRTMLPGFVDAHGHVMGGGLQALSANLLSPPDGQVRDIPSLQQTLRDWMKDNRQAVEKVQLVVGFGYDNAQLAELRHPDRDDLDVLSTEVPIVLVHQSGHIISVNSKALELGGITKDSVNPAGGVIRRRQNSQEPNGVLEETAAFPLLFKLVGRVGPEGAAIFLRAGADRWASFGYTTAQDGRSMPDMVKIMQQVAAAGDLEIDVVAYPDVLVDRNVIKQEFNPNYKNRFRVGGAKLTIDGSPQGFTAWRD
ncbi:MAG: amidohydrolase family protein, partial [Pirellulaceae bacterium]|nr:amidohydrolase family protein [Pirellulaceae bacterium]